MKPVIGVYPSYDTEKKRYWLNEAYISSVISSGGIPFILPVSGDDFLNQAVLARIDGLLLTGGADIAPEYYGVPNTGKSLEICPLRDLGEKSIIGLALNMDTPVLAICRGMQALTVFTDGSLYEDIPSDYKTSITHTSSDENISIHSVSVNEGSLLASIIGGGEHRFNSYHHQAVKELGKGFKTEAVSEDGLIEAISLPEKKFVLGVQWHPERMYESEESKKLFGAFISACSDGGKR